MKRIDQLKFVNSYASLPAEHFHAAITPQPLEGSHLVHFNHNTATLLGIDPSLHSEEELLAYLAGERLIPGSSPLATVYAGHQFGGFVPQLGDGRALLLGEVVGADNAHWELQLKGSGRTPFSRQGDGRAVLRSSIREYLASEAMVGLGIPSTRALALVGSKEPVWRESIERGAMLLRVAPSHLRFGHFEYFYRRGKAQQLRQLADFLIDHHYPDLRNDGLPYLSLFEQVVERTAYLMARWQLVGFAHGVMNTDNMSVLGLTLDYGPFGFLDDFDPGFICNHSDYQGRYAFDQQPYIAQWNLSRFGQTLMGLIDPDPSTAAEMANVVLASFEARFYAHYEAGLNAKLGLAERQADDFDLGLELLEWLADEKLDYTCFFRALGELSRDPATPAPDSLTETPDQLASLQPWIRRYRARLALDQRSDCERKAAMDRVNPLYILRNYLAQEAIVKAEEGDYSGVEELFELLQKPFEPQPGMQRYARPAPQWGKELAISCSS